MSFPAFLTAAGQPAFTTETRTGDYIITPAFGANEPTALVIAAEHTQTRADYSRPAANSNISYGSATAYYVDDVDFQDLGGGVQIWTRLWATRPASWSEPGGTYAFTFPGYTGTTAFGNIFPISNIAANGNTILVSTNATGISAGDDVYLDLNYSRTANYHVTFHTTATAASSGVSVNIGPILPGTGTFTNPTGTVRRGDTSRSAAETLEVDSWLLHDYALSSEAAVDSDLPQIPKFQPTSYGFGSTGAEVQFLTASTVPNTTLYKSMINAGTLLVAAPSERRKYAGQIYERITRLVVAR